MKWPHGPPRPDKCVAFEFSPAPAKTLPPFYSYIEDASGSVAVAKRFTRVLTAQCRYLGRLPTVLGRSRPELRPGIRSFPFKNYIIVMRYVENTLEIINVVEGHRDLEAIFRKDK